jgi:hypothetical protein
MVRVLLAGVVAGVLVFAAGAFSHVVLELEGRAFKRVQDEAAVRDLIGKQAPEAGIYSFPSCHGLESLSGEEQKKEWDRLNEEYKQGPAGTLIVAPTGEDAMGPKQLGLEFLTNVAAALIAAWIVSRTAPGTGFITRWLIVFLLGAFTWLSTSASFAIWYRFPTPFILDGLYAALIESAVAGLAIALIVRPAPNGKPAVAGTEA